MPEWFRLAVYWLIRPEQCVRCGTEIREGGWRRDTFEVFCDADCALDWDSWR